MASPKQSNKPEVPPGALSNITPGAGGIIQLTPEDEVFVNDYAQQNGIPKAEALRRLLLHSQAQREMPEKPTVFQRGMDAIDQANRLGFGTQQDPNSALNMMGSALAMKHVGDALKGDPDNNKKGKISIDDIKELMYLKMMGNLSGDNNNQPLSVVQEMKAENDKLRQELKDADTKRMAEMDKLKSDMRDMLFEKKIETLEKTQSESINSLANQLSEITQKIEFYKNAPPNPTPEQAKDAIGHLEDLSKQVSRIKNVFGDLGIIPSTPQTHTLTPGTEVYREKDGSINKTMYAIDKLTGALEKGLDAWTKKKPEFERLEDTPPPESRGPGDRITIQMTMSPLEYFNFLLAKPDLTQDEANYIEQNRHKYLPAPSQYKPPVEEPKGAQHDQVISEPEPVSEMGGEKKSVMERLKEQEDEQIRRNQEIGQ